MDPNLFHLDWGKTLEALATIVVLAFMIERGLSVVFENSIFIKVLSDKGAKEIITLIVCAFLCYGWHFDAMSIILSAEKSTFWGALITGSIIAGGSKASLKLFRDILGFMSSAEKERQAIKQAKITKLTQDETDDTKSSKSSNEK